MKKLLIATALASGFASTALAGAVEYVAPVEPVVIAAAPVITDWSGPYAGVLAAMGTATQDYTYDFGEGTETWTGEDLEGNMYGVFAGYNIQNGGFVFGVEGAYSMGSIGRSYTPPQAAYEEGEELTSVIDLKARAGIAAGDALIYGFAGWSMGDFRMYEEPSYDETISVDGMNYGVGVDLFVTDRVFVGAEYIMRDLSGESGVDETVDLAVQAVQVRLGMNF